MHNLYRDADEPSRFEARATNAQIPQSELPAYREMLTREGQVFLEKVDAWLTHHEVDPGTATATRESAPAARLGVGVYWIQSTDGNL
jgi:hypothetical protein